MPALDHNGDRATARSHFGTHASQRLRPRTARNHSNDRRPSAALRRLDSDQHSQQSARRSGARYRSHSRQTHPRAAQGTPHRRSRLPQHVPGRPRIHQDGHSPPAIPQRLTDVTSSPRLVFESDVPLSFRLLPDRGPGGLHLHKLAKIAAYYHRL